MSQHTKLIAEQNDRFRSGDLQIPGRIVVTAALAATLQEQGEDLRALHQAVAEFSDFTEENDPHAEHDFGQFTFAGENCYWKIDLYNNTLDGGSEAPEDLTQTHRVLTIMLARDY